jgi:hypothetical protein
MTHDRSLNFSNRNLRNRSFKGQTLNHADFSGSDLRGCDFSQAQLVGANFERVKTGQTRQQKVWLFSVALGTGAVVFDSVSRLIFASLGQTPEDEAWSFVLVLYAVLAIASVTAGLSLLFHSKSRISRLAGLLSGCCAAALVGFFQVGSHTDNNAQMAIAGALIGVIGVAVLGAKPSRSMPIAIGTAGTVTAYGFAFLVGTTAIALLSVQRFVGGIGWSAITLIWIGLTVAIANQVIVELQSFAGTSFRGANLTNAKFTEATLHHTDFTGTIGWDTSR